jgi:hypothetical protein
MKFRTFENANVVREQYLKLKENSVHNCVELIVVDSNGNAVSGGSILRVSEKGVFLFAGVNSRLGILLDARKRVKICSN